MPSPSLLGALISKDSEEIGANANMILDRNLLNEAPCATWFMVVADGIHDLFMNNEREAILVKYGNRVVRKFVGMGGDALDDADTVKIVLQ